jgi:hypothetical protein
VAENTETRIPGSDELLDVAALLLLFSLDPNVVASAEWVPAVEEWLGNFDRFIVSEGK